MRGGRKGWGSPVCQTGSCYSRACLAGPRGLSQRPLGGGVGWGVEGVGVGVGRGRGRGGER